MTARQSKKTVERKSAMSPLALQEQQEAQAAAALAAQMRELAAQDKPPAIVPAEQPKEPASDDGPPPKQPAADNDIDPALVAKLVEAELRRQRDSEADSNADQEPQTTADLVVPNVVPGLVPKMVGTNQPPKLGTNPGTNFGPTEVNHYAAFGFGGQNNHRQDRITKRKTHPRQVPADMHWRSWKALCDGVRLAADAEGMSPNQWISQAIEGFLRMYYPEQMANSYAASCRDLGVPNDWQPMAAYTDDEEQ